MKIYIQENGITGPIILWGMHMWNGNEIDDLVSSLKTLVPDFPFILASFDPDSWNDAFSPWKANCDNQEFAGEGKKTLEWITKEFLPNLKEQYPDSTKTFIAGYSLAGLFALWSLYETDVFDGAASCSGSLWFPNWDGYANQATIKPDTLVYLSLGGKEKNSKSPFVSTVEDKTKTQYNLLKDIVSDTILEMNPGGHFSNPELRAAKGIAWLIKHR